MYEMRGLCAPSEFKPEVTEGTLIVFPGYLDHLVPLCQSDKPRTIVSFNLIRTGNAREIYRFLKLGNVMLSSELPTGRVSDAC